MQAPPEHTPAFASTQVSVAPPPPQVQTPAEQAPIAPEHTLHPAGAEVVPQRVASVTEHDTHAPPLQYLPAPQEESDVQTQAPSEHVGVAPEHTAHPAGEAVVPQCAASVSEHAVQMRGASARQ